MSDESNMKFIADKLSAVGEPTRLRIIRVLTTGPKTVGDIANALKVPIVNVSHHLGVLRNNDILRDQKQGRYVQYSLNPDVFHPATTSESEGALDLGGCRLEFIKQEEAEPKPAKKRSK